MDGKIAVDFGRAALETFILELKKQQKSLISYAGRRNFQKRTDFQRAARVSRRQTLDEIPTLHSEFYLDM